VTAADLSNEAFPYMTMQEIDIGYAKALAFRVTYLGELGYELYIPTEFAPAVYDLLWEAGQESGVKNAGLQALNSLRIEKAYRDYGHDMDVTDTPLEAGLGFIVDFEKPGGFIGREALLKQKQAGSLRKRFVQFVLEDPKPMLYYGEPVYRDGVWVGYIHSGAYGFTLGASVGLSMLAADEPITPEYLASGRFEIEINAARYPARASLRPFYDPQGERVRA
jgi:4-methylaminobutanoate oxidase (formaldehyde-forming)